MVVFLRNAIEVSFHSLGKKPINSLTQPNGSENALLTKPRNVTKVQHEQAWVDNVSTHLINVFICYGICK